MKVASLQSKLPWGIMGEGLMFQFFKNVRFRWTKLLQPALICPHSHCWIFLSFSVWKSHSEKKIKDNHVWAFRKCMKCIFSLLACRSAYVGCMSSYSTPHHIVETTVSQWISVWLRVLHATNLLHPVVPISMSFSIDWPQNIQTTSLVIWTRTSCLKVHFQILKGHFHTKRRKIP